MKYIAAPDAENALPRQTHEMHHCARRMKCITAPDAENASPRQTQKMQKRPPYFFVTRALKGFMLITG